MAKGTWLWMINGANREGQAAKGFALTNDTTGRQAGWKWGHTNHRAGCPFRTRPDSVNILCPGRRWSHWGIIRKRNLRWWEWRRGIAYLLVMYANVMDLWAVHIQITFAEKRIHDVLRHCQLVTSEMTINDTTTAYQDASSNSGRQTDKSQFDFNIEATDEWVVNMRTRRYCNVTILLFTYFML